ncbi:MAG: integrase core domain-containing protein [Desulfovibrio sp.]
MRTRPYTPRTNGKAERFIQAALREWAYAAGSANSNERASELPRWLLEYNCYRNHSALQDKPPITRIDLAVNDVLQLHRSRRPRRRPNAKRVAPDGATL